MSELSKEEKRILSRLNTPIKIQDFLDSLPMNFEENGETYMSVSEALKHKTAHCMEGALVAAAALMLQGQKPLLLDLKVLSPDVDHVVALYRINNLWGAISKTNHATVRFRDPIYKTIRELAISYFHEYFLDTSGKKTLHSYSEPFDLRKTKTNWLTGTENLQPLVEEIDNSKHYSLYPARQSKFIRKADKMERKAGALREW